MQVPSIRVESAIEQAPRSRDDEVLAFRILSVNSASDALKGFEPPTRLSPGAKLLN